MQDLGLHTSQFPDPQAKLSTVNVSKWDALVEILLEWKVEKWFCLLALFFFFSLIVFLAWRTLAAIIVFMTVRVTDTATKSNKSLGMLALYFLLRPCGSLKSSSVIDMPACAFHIRQHDFNRAVSIMTQVLGLIFTCL